MLLNETVIDRIMIAAQGTDSGSPLQAYQHIRLQSNGKFNAIGSSGHIQVVASCDLPDGQGDDCFDICLPADRLTKIIQAARGDIKITVDDGVAAIKAGTSRFKVPLFDVKTFGLMPPDEKTASVIIPAALLISAMERVLPFASQKDVSRPWMNAMLLELKDGKLNFVATDGFGMAIQTFDLDVKEQFSVSLPIGVFRKLKGLVSAEGNLAISTGTRITIESAAGVIDTALHSQKYTDWQRLTGAADGKNTATIKAGEAAALFAEAMIVAEHTKAGVPVRLTFQEDGISLESGHAGSAYSGKIAGKCSANAAAGLECVAVREILSQFPKDTDVTIRYTDSFGVFTFTSEAIPGYTVLRMPYKV